MSQYQYDPEMMADLYYKISKEFMESPDERITWLESLAETHRAVSCPIILHINSALLNLSFRTNTWKSARRLRSSRRPWFKLI